MREDFEKFVKIVEESTYFKDEVRQRIAKEEDEKKEKEF